VPLEHFPDAPGGPRADDARFFPGGRAPGDDDDRPDEAPGQGRPHSAQTARPRGAPAANTAGARGAHRFALLRSRPVGTRYSGATMPWTSPPTAPAARAVTLMTSSWVNGSGKIPAAMLLMQEMPSTRTPMCRAAMTSG